MIELFKDLGEDEANSYALTLSAYNISHRVIKERSGGLSLYVDEWNHEKALDIIKRYIEENRSINHTDLGLQGEYGKTFTGLWAATILLVCYTVVVACNQNESIIRTYGSSASHILRGELYRTATSLMLHTNALHLAGNMVGIALFGTAVCSVAGWGVGWVMILASGIIGNTANAFLYRAGHLSIGASTAVFGAIGILCAQQFLKKLRSRGYRMKAWLPLGGGLALLGILGSGENSDIMAHLFGFVAGISLGGFYALLIKKPAKKAWQFVCFIAVLIVLVVAWMVPI